MPIPDLADEAAAVNVVAARLHTLLGPDDASARLLAEGFGDVIDGVIRLDGSSSTREVELDAELAADVMAMRAASYREGQGAWFVANLTVYAEPTRPADYVVDRTLKPGLVHDPDDVRFDLGWFPRDPDRRPPWFADLVAERDPVQIMDEEAQGWSHDRVLTEGPIGYTLTVRPGLPRPRSTGPQGELPQPW